MSFGTTPPSSFYLNKIMRHTFLILFLLVAIAFPAFADAQRYVYFHPASESVTVYRADSAGYGYALPLAVADLAAPQQATVGACLAWLQSQLDEGETLSQVIFAPYQIPDDPATAEIDESGLGLRATVTGRNASGGERTLPDPIDSKDVPFEVRAGLVGLWTDLAAIPTP